MTPAISVSNLSKKYILRHLAQRSARTIKEALPAWGKNALATLRGQPPQTKNGNKNQTEEFWALKNINFEVNAGDRIGIIGRNGAGKSTLLKILSRITAPTTGRIQIQGRLTGLLEVGTGFHPELTGRENIFLNGALMGMSHRSILKVFDQIAAFAAIEKFLDVPVKFYSSGMYVRLAFAAAAHIESDILLLDEVLAVGDAFFQKKCLGKMKDISQSGRTILFVSHSMDAIERFCNKVIFLENGSIRKFNENTRDTIKQYLEGSPDELLTGRWQNDNQRYQNPWFTPQRLYLGDINGNPRNNPIRNDEDCWVYLEGEIKELDLALNLGYALYDDEGHFLYLSFHTDAPEQHWPRLGMGLNCLRSRIPKHLLNEGNYRIELIGCLYFREWIFQPGGDVPVIHLTIRGGLSDSPYWLTRRPGLLAPHVEWTTVLPGTAN